MFHRSLVPLFVILVALLSGRATAATYGDGVWPEFTTLPNTGVGARDAALVVGVEQYDHYSDLRGAVSSAQQWARWLELTHGIPGERVILLTDQDASCMDIRRSALTMANKVPDGGTLWVVFVGRGALSADGTDALLLGANADPGADAPQGLGLPLSGLMEALGQGVQKRSFMVLDTAFVRAGASADGSGSAPVVLQPGPVFHSRGSATALLASNNGRPLERLAGLDQPPFGYLLLGALRGWADTDKNERVTAGEALAWVREALGSFDIGQASLPAGWGAVDGQSLSQTREFAPDLGEINWRAAERRIQTRIHELDESEQMLRAEASAIWQAVLGAYGMGGDAATASVRDFLLRWSVAHVQVDRMKRWLLVPELEDARALLEAAEPNPAGPAESRTVEGERYVQLQEEIAQFIRRNAWKGVEATYQEMRSLSEQGGVSIVCEDHLHGAQAARQLGDAASVYDRLLQAVEAGPTEEVVQWLNDLEGSYGRVRLENTRRDPALLEAASMPFAPDRRAAVLAAQERIEDQGQFEGLLPAGVYRFGGEIVVVAPGDAPVELVLQKARKNGR